MEADTNNEDQGKTIATEESMKLYGRDLQTLKRILENAQKDRAESIAEFQKMCGPNAQWEIENGNK